MFYSDCLHKHTHTHTYTHMYNTHTRARALLSSIGMAKQSKTILYFSKLCYCRRFTAAAAAAADDDDDDVQAVHPMVVTEAVTEAVTAVVWAVSD